MDGLREIARAYYERSEKERKSAQTFFNSLGADRTGKVTFQKFQRSAGWWLRERKIFDQLDKNGDGALDFDESLALHYMVKKVRILKCNECGDLLVGPYFSCFLCLGEVPNTFDLCCACYRGGKFEHQHPSSEFLDHHALLMRFRDRTTDEVKNPGKREMDGIRKIARAYYARASKKEINLIKRSFKGLDDGTGKVSLQKFKASADSWLLHDKLFKQLDENGDGALDFDEFLALDYMTNKARILKCFGCKDFLVGPYFSCLECLGKEDHTYDLCCACFRGKKYRHQHQSSEFSDHHALLMRFREQTKDAQKNKGKQEMEELTKIAKAHYQAASRKVQARAKDFFEALDTNRDGRVDLPEFLEFMRQEGHARMRNPQFFKELDKDGNNRLDFNEVMTLYYIIKSGRPFCDCCGEFIPGVYFSCIECFMSPKGSFNLCSDCYQSRRYNHNHNGKVQFLDNYTLLEVQKNSAVTQATGVNQNEPITAGSSYVVDPPSPVTSNAIVLAPKPNKAAAAEAALKALEAALSIASISASACTIL